MALMATVLITGANRGLGLGLARTYLDDGWNVIAVVRQSSQRLESIETDRLETRYCDLVDDDDLAALAHSLADRTIDVLINNAGRMAQAPESAREHGIQGFGYFDRTLWREVLDINLFTPMALSELLIDAVARAPRGRIVTLSSMLGSQALNDSGGLYAYRASKAGVNAITKSMAVDLAGRGVIAIALHPGWVRTDMGGPDAPLDVARAVRGMKAVIDGLGPEDTGKFLGWDGSELPW
jgi:NAD(P)-dependent dehydrogenase (short-subunit alcohol dehydrogenase family)